MSVKKTEPICVFCFKNNGSLRSFLPSYLEKCKNILEIRKNKDLSMQDAIVPEEINEFQRYHSNCYRLFTALPKKYRTSVLSGPSCLGSSFQKDSQGSEQQAGDVNVGASSTNQNKGDVVDVPSDTCEGEIVQSEIDKTKNREDSNDKETVCIFCNKKRKKMHGREQGLHTCVATDQIKSQANEVGDLDLLNKIDEKCANNLNIFYHSCCKLNYRNTCRSIVTSRKSVKTQWHLSRSTHKAAFDEVCRFVTTNVIDKKQCFYLSFLKSMYIEFAKNHGTDSTINVEPYNLDNRLLEKFPKKINIITVSNKKIVKPYSGNLLQNDFDMLEKQDILDRAARS